MTCCVASPGLLCTDSRETGAVKRDALKHFRTKGYLVGMAGDCAALAVAEHVISWPATPNVKVLTRLLHEHHDRANCDFGEVSLLIVTAKRVFVAEGVYVYETTHGAIGSGSPYALGYLRAHPDDLEGAVAAACYWDPYCAGPVRRVEV